MRRCLIVAIWLTLMFPAWGAAQPVAHRVLILRSFDYDFAPDDAFARLIRTDLNKASPTPLEFFDVSLQPAPTIEVVKEEPVVEYLRSTLAGQQLDLVMTISGPAAAFAQKYRALLFPSTPILLTGMDRRWAETTPLTANETAVSMDFEVGRIVEDILHVSPQTSHVFVVVGHSKLEEFWADALKREVQGLTDRVSFTWSNDLSFEDILKRAAALPPNSAILYFLMTVDAKGQSLSEERALAELHAVANAPMFGIYDTQLGRGTVGGPVFPVTDMARTTASVALRILRGESPGDIKLPPQAVGRPTYDWRELRRWSISDARLPAGSLVLFRQPGVWDQYNVYIVSAAAIVALQSALIAGLVFQRARRRRAERALRRSFEQNQDLAGQLINAQEVERTRIARDLHDDVGQQLAGVGIMLSGLKRKVGRVAAEPEIDRAFTALQERTSTLADAIRSLSHELHPTVMQTVGLAAALERHCAEVDELHHLKVVFRADGNLGALSADAALSLFRVAQEALTNAVRHARPHTIHVELMAAGDRVELRVVDDGVGFVTDERPRRGLGLRSMDERVRLAQGHLDIESGPGQGTRVLVRMPLAAAPIPVAEQG